MANTNNSAQGSTSLPTTSFFGTKRKAIDPGQLEKLRKIEDQAEKFQKFPLPELPPNPSLSDGHCTIFEIFSRQDPALQFCKQTGQGVKPFSVEHPVFPGGKREYRAAHPLTIWARQKATQPDQRNFYEIIPEDAPCKLYFDLEYEKDLNPETIPKNLTDTFMEIICWALQDKLNVDCTPRDVIILEASTPTKFSQHWIFPTVIFQSFRHTGNFVKHVCKLIDSGSLPFDKSTLENLQIHNKHGQKVLFVDKGVYNKNRNFRVYLSTKKGQNNPLVVSPDNRWPYRKEKSLFLDSLITYISNPTISTLTFEVEPAACSFSQGNRTLSQSQPTSQGPDNSPFPEIDNFITSLIYPDGRISKWMHFEDSKRLVYYFYDYRFCENVDRHHKSNNILLIVDLEGGNYWQKCLDPDCARFRSISRPIRRQSQNQSEGWDPSVSDHDLVAVAEAAEASYSGLA